MSAKRVCIYPKIPDHPTVPDFTQIIDRFEKEGIISAESASDSLTFYPGCRFKEYFEIDAEQLNNSGWNTFVTVEFKRFTNEDLGFAFNAPGISVPTIVGTDSKVEDWQLYLTQWLKDRAFRFFEPQTGKTYFPYELDFKHTFGIGNHFIVIDNFQSPPKPALLELLSEYSPVNYNYCIEYI